MAAKFSEQYLFKPTQNSNVISPCMFLMGGGCDLGAMLSGLGCFCSGRGQGFRGPGIKYTYALFPELKKKRQVGHNSKKEPISNKVISVLTVNLAELEAHL